MSAVAGYVLGFIMARYREIFFAMLSLALSMILYGILVRSAALGSTDGFNLPPPRFFGFVVDGQTGRLLVYALTVVIATGTAMVLHQFVNSPAGVIGEAILTNEIRVEYLGTSVTGVLHLTYVIGATTAGLGGVRAGLRRIVRPHAEGEAGKHLQHRNRIADQLDEHGRLGPDLLLAHRGVRELGDEQADRGILLHVCCMFAQLAHVNVEGRKIVGNDISNHGEIRLAIRRELEDLEALPRGGISTSSAPAAPAASAEKPEADKKDKSKEKEEDPVEKLRKRLDPLRTELDAVEAQLRSLRSAGASGNTTGGGVDVSQTAGGVNTLDQISRLEQRRSELQRQIVAVEDEARRKGIAPGAIR